MRARELAESYPVVSVDTDALEAVRLMADRQLPALIVFDVNGKPRTVLPDSQALRFIIPEYLQEDPALCRVLSEEASGELFRALAGLTVGDLLRQGDSRELPIVDHDATTMEIAAVMARMRSSVVAVVDGGQFLGAITLVRLLPHVMPGGPATP